MKSSAITRPIPTPIPILTEWGTWSKLLRKAIRYEITIPAGWQISAIRIFHHESCIAAPIAR